MRATSTPVKILIAADVQGIRCSECRVNLSTFFKTQNLIYVCVECFSSYVRRSSKNLSERPQVAFPEGLRQLH